MPDARGEIDVGSATNWALKGQGSANAVFGYSGADASLVRYQAAAAAQLSEHDSYRVLNQPN